MEKQAKVRKRTNFSLEEKKVLASLVKHHKPVWDLKSPDHRNADAVAASWQSISKEMQRTEEDCKRAWRSIRDSNRYYSQKKGETKKSGSGLDIDALQEQNTSSQEPCEWELGESLSFLKSAASQRKTFASTLRAEEAMQDSMGSSYSYESTPSSKKQKVNTMEEKTCELISMMSSMIESSQNGQLKHHGMLSNLDSLLQKLPEEDVMELNLKFINMTVDAIRKNNLTGKM